MADLKRNRVFILDLDMLNTYNSEGCKACGSKFNLGDQVVWACGEWQGGPQLVHAQEAVWDKASETYFERHCYAGRTH